MSIVATLYEHRDFRGFSKTSSVENFRYYWNRWGASNDVFSSMRAWSNGARGNAFAFQHFNFDGRFAALNLRGGSYASWWSYFGDSFNDSVSSSLIVRRASADREIVLPLRSVVAAQFTSLFDAETQGTALSRRGDPRLYATYFPSHDQNRVFATIDQDLRVEVDWWADYDANVRYDVRFYLADGRLRGYAAWSHVWVESGILSGTVHDRIAPKLHEAKAAITSAIGAALSAFGRRTFSSVYLLPGPAPDMNTFGYFARHDDDVTLAIGT